MKLWFYCSPQHYRQFGINMIFLTFLFVERPLVEYCMSLVLFAEEETENATLLSFFLAPFGEFTEIAQFVMQLLLATCFNINLISHLHVRLDSVQVSGLDMSSTWVARGWRCGDQQNLRLKLQQIRLPFALSPIASHKLSQSVIPCSRNKRWAAPCNKYPKKYEFNKGKKMCCRYGKWENNLPGTHVMRSIWF